MIKIDDLKFDSNGLIPAIITDAETKDVLMMAYMNRESLAVSLNEGTTCFWSRSRKQLWRKGETSGNRQHIVSVFADCDLDCLTISVKKDGPACHTGAGSCFHNEVMKCGEQENLLTVDDLYALLLERKTRLPEGSYTTYLFQKGIDKILKKIGEESAEVIIAGKSGDKTETVYEIADLAYHVLVLMAHSGITPDDIRGELANRHVIDRKIKQEKMVQ